MDERFLARFMAKVSESADGCWLWTGMVNSTSPYPRFYAGDTAERWAHRISHLHFVGPIPEGYEVDHLCRVTLCVNPAHLEAVTPEVNKRRAFDARPARSYEHGEVERFWQGCRCDDCRTAYGDYAKTARLRRRAEAASGLRSFDHGTNAGYATYLCRCADCSAAGLSHAAKYRTRKVRQPRPEAEHGTTSRYTAYKCRCDLCRKCWSDYWKAHRRAKKAAAA